jgi:endoglucanase
MTWYRFPIGVLVTASSLACDPGSSSSNTSCGAEERQVGGECVATVERAVRLNSVGFLPDRIKRATFRGGSGAFQVVDRQGNVVFEGMASEPVDSAETGEQGLRVADFTDFSDPDPDEQYQVRAEDAGDSPSFRIAPDVMTDVARGLMLGLYGQRCGEAVSFDFKSTTFEHAACHTADALLDDHGEAGQRHPVLYGWHDAGDYGKYVNNGALSLGNMLIAWQQYPALESFSFGLPDSEGLPEFLAECRFQLDWLLGMQVEGGGVADRVTTRTFDAMVSPEASIAPRYLAPVTGTATADFAAVVARAARAYEPYDAELSATYREAALAAWGFLSENAQISVSEAVRGRFTGSYWSSDADDRLWAAAEIWELTGDADALALFEERAATLMVDNFWDWPSLSNLATFTYLLSERDGRDPELVAKLTEALGASVNSIYATAIDHPYGRGTGITYYWGINGVLARMALNVGVYDSLVPDAKHRDLMVMVMDHLLGRNYYGRSYVTGIGYDPPYHPHHRPSVADRNPEPWPGLLVGGPWSNDQRSNATAWVDSASDYNTNEVAINWNAAMIYAAAALLP